MTWKKIYRDFLAQFTDEDGVQENNLTPQEASGLKKLQKRVREELRKRPTRSISI